MIDRRLVVLLLLALCTVPGCGDARHAGGTPGSLVAGGQPLDEIQVTVHRPEGAGFLPVGFGVATTDGSFRLFAPGALADLRLEPGEYRFTLESVGAPVVVPKEYASPDTTPLRRTWTATDEKLLLEIPAVFAPTKGGRPK
jgi:hypothetical protein